jgi:predicted Zn-dependent protease
MLTEQGGTVHAGCAWQAARDEDARSAAEIARLEERTLDVLEQRFGATTTRSLQLYVDGIHEQVTGVRPSELVFPNLAEPGLAALPAGGLAVSLGLLATLEDEAQLGFVVARESFLARGGWPLRRFESAAAQRRRLIWWRGGLDDRLEEAVLLGLRVGYGPEIEREADREGLAALVRADYCPSAGLAALRALDAASPAGRGGRFVVTPERERWLEHAARGLGQPPTARLNREVYRRAVGGFAVFSETTRA